MRNNWRKEEGGFSVEGFLGARGIKTHNIKSTEELLDLAARFFNVDRAPTCSEMAASIRSLSKGARRRAAKAYRQSSAPPPIRIETVSPKKPVPSPPEYPAPSNIAINEFYHSWEWKRLRYSVLKERGRRCECCGSAADHGARIVVDHIKPIRRFWGLRLDKSNCQVLCDDCNRGKGYWDQTDWRKAV